MVASVTAVQFRLQNDIKLLKFQTKESFSRLLITIIKITSGQNSMRTNENVSRQQERIKDFEHRII